MSFEDTRRSHWDLIRGSRDNELVVGCLFFIIGGFMAGGLFISLRSFGVVLMTAYGFHNTFSPFVLLLIFIGFVMANFNARRAERAAGWGFDFELFSSNTRSLRDSDHDSAGSDGGGDGGGD